MKTLSRGILLSLEGIDGSGKSTLINNLATRFTAQDFPLIITKEPGGTALGKQLRVLLQEQITPITSRAEFLLFAADRAQHFDTVIIPNLQRNMMIISDRMADSSLAYQGFGRGLDHAMITTINTWAMNGIQPDLTLYIKVPSTVAQERLKSRTHLSAFDQAKKDFIEKLIVGFDTIFASRSNVIHLDGTQSSETLTDQAYSAIITWMITNTIIPPTEIDQNLNHYQSS